jgi:hypothetical protein
MDFDCVSKIRVLIVCNFFAKLTQSKVLLTAEKVLQPHSQFVGSECGVHLPLMNTEKQTRLHPSIEVRSRIRG